MCGDEGPATLPSRAARLELALRRHEFVVKKATGRMRPERLQYLIWQGRQQRRRKRPIASLKKRLSAPPKRRPIALLQRRQNDWLQRKLSVSLRGTLEVKEEDATRKAAEADLAR